jgi:predicted Zn finger-like uncharacterized protein
MHIVCPHCTTSYAIDLAALGTAGRNVRCSRCKETWLARPEDVVRTASPMVAAAAGQQTGDADDAAAEWETLAREDESFERDAPVIDSPSISADWPEAGEHISEIDNDLAAVAGDDAGHGESSRLRFLSKLRGLSPFRSFRLPKLQRRPRKAPTTRPFAGLPTACAAMGALALALIIWRANVVRLLPQTATFYQLVGLDVNLRGLSFKDVKITRETVEGKPVLVIEGVITGETHKTVELPRLRFSVIDAQGAEVYAWNALLDQQVLKPGEKAWFKSRLASPPPEGRHIDIRFFNKRDIAGGSA